jgi:hypothetical protein
MIILLNYPIESSAANTIKQQTNTPSNLKLIEQRYNQLGTDNVYQYIINHVITNPELYGADVSLLVKEGRYSEAVDLTASNERTMVHFGHLFDDVYNNTFADITDTDSKLVITLPHNTNKPSNVDVFIGWAVSESEYEVDHMEEHEGIPAKQSYTICDAHNKWMRNNKHLYDVFFDGNIEQEVLDYIRQL